MLFNSHSSQQGTTDLLFLGITLTHIDMCTLSSQEAASGLLVHLLGPHPTPPLNPLEPKFPTAASICCQVHSRLRSGVEEVETKDENKKRDGRRSIPGQNNGEAFRSPLQPPSNIAAVLIVHLSPPPPSVGQLTHSHTWHLLKKIKQKLLSLTNAALKRTQRCQGALHSASIGVCHRYI